jgi:hypothetical protein
LPTLASFDDVRQAAAKVLKTGDYVLRGVWDWIPTNEREVLSALALENQATVKQLVHTLQTPESKVQPMVERLIEMEVIEVIADGSGQPAYRFQVELLRRWVERHMGRAGVGFARSALY